MSKIKNLLQIKYINVQPSDAITSYIQKKVFKHEAESKEITAIICNINLDSSRAGKTYTLTLETAMHHSGFIVREKGGDIYKLVDEISDKFRSRLIKFLDKQNDTTGTSAGGEIGWIDSYVQEMKDDYNNVVIDQREANKQLIVERKRYYDNSPIHIEEAIQMMEMVGRPCFLFKNIDTGKYAVVYKVDSNGSKGKVGYGLLEHREH
jgi:ribosome-associated translation inhibitor RaiA